MWQYYLMANEGVISKEPSKVTTVLGSCVSATFYDPVRKWGGLFHALLPRMADYTRNSNKSMELPWRYVDTSIEAMVKKFRDMGSPPDKLQIKIFGGAEVLIPSEERREPKSVGMQNVKAALDTFQRLDLRIVASDVGGKRGRKIIYFTHTGEVLLKRLQGREQMLARDTKRVGG